MDIFLLRHFESVKNTQVSFSSVDDLEDLTIEGIEHGKATAKNLKLLLQICSLNVKKIYCADSTRAKKSAELISQTIGGGVTVQKYKELLSTKSKDTIGKTKEEVRRTNPLFMQELALYDAGIYNSYTFHRAVGKEEKIQYEKQVCQCIDNIIHNEEDENAKIICLHNSSITAIAINIARQFYDYPKDYYGKVIADNGKIFWIREDKSKLNFITANCDSQLLLDIVTTMK